MLTSRSLNLQHPVFEPYRISTFCARQPIKKEGSKLKVNKTLKLNSKKRRNFYSNFNRHQFQEQRMKCVGGGEGGGVGLKVPCDAKNALQSNSSYGMTTAQTDVKSIY